MTTDPTPTDPPTPEPAPGPRPKPAPKAAPDLTPKPAPAPKPTPTTDPAPTPTPDPKPAQEPRYPRARLRTRIGAAPALLTLLAASFALSAWAGWWLLDGDPVAVAAWFVGCALLHDLVLVPLYAGGDRLLQRVLRRGPLPVAFVRVPAVLSLLLLAVWWPLITGHATDRYETVTGLDGDVFRTRWLLATALFFAVSAGAYAATRVRRVRRARRHRAAARHPR